MYMNVRVYTPLEVPDGGGDHSTPALLAATA